jgi:hypothetical protein
MVAIREVFRNAGRTPLPLGTAESGLLAVERRIARPLPATFREFYALENGPSLLDYYSNSDRPLRLAELAEPSKRWHGYDPLGENILPFMIENQGVGAWGIRLDGGDDPQVVVEVDCSVPPVWQKCADRFTDWLESQVENFRLFENCWFRADGPELTDETLRLLRQHFEEGIQTYAWPGKTNYRFFNDRSNILLWSQDGMCSWWIAPMSTEHVAAALDEIAQITGIETDLCGIEDQHEDMLSAWRLGSNFASRAE